MEIEIRHMEKTKEGTGIIAVIPELERPPTPQYKTGDSEGEKKKKREYWKEMLRIYDEKQKEIKLLHLGDAELIQKEGNK